MIPKIIWQTFRTNTLPLQSLENVKTWISLHEKYDYYYMNDINCEKFIRENFNNSFVKMYNDLPLGVMKSDVWRVAIIYVYGGIYADLDTSCLSSLNDYIEKYNLIVSIEPPTQNIGNFCFAASPKHDAFLKMLEDFLYYYNSKNFLSKNSPTPVQDFGAGIFNNCIKEYITNNIGDKKIKLFNLEDNAFTSTKNKKCLVHHNDLEKKWEKNYWKNQNISNYKKNEND